MTAAYDPRQNRRRSLRLQGYDYTRPGAYFVTICTYQRKSFFGEVFDGGMILTQMGRIAQQEWERLPARFPSLELGSFVVMPNHMHAILILIDDPGRGTTEDGKDTGQEVTRRAPTAERFIDPGRNTAEDGNGPGQDIPCHAPTEERFGHPVRGSIPTIVRSYKSSVSWRINRLREHPNHPVWQRNYYEHVIRDHADWERIDTYIRENPRLWDKDQLNPNQME